MPQSVLKQHSISYIYNDDMRLDGYNAICLSVMFPNDCLLNRFRKKYPDKKYAVLTLEPSILWEKPCKFFNYNAASSGAKNAEKEHKTPLEAFEAMFAEEVNTSTFNGSGCCRRAANERSFLPTTSQAEVLVGDIIEPAYIRDIFVENPDVKNLLEKTVKVSKPDIAICQPFFLFRDKISWKI